MELIQRVLDARWWSSDDFAADGTAVVVELPEILRTAVAAVRGDL